VNRKVGGYRTGEEIIVDRGPAATASFCPAHNVSDDSQRGDLPCWPQQTSIRHRLCREVSDDHLVALISDQVIDVSDLSKYDPFSGLFWANAAFRLGLFPWRYWPLAPRQWALRSVKEHPR
jgi:hypothetical protein